MREVYAQIMCWAFAQLREPDREPTLHVVGYIVHHEHLVNDTRQPYIGSRLTDIDLDRRQVRNRRGKVIVLVGEPLPPSELPSDLCRVMRRAEAEWEVEDGATWERMAVAWPR